jgi:hypothetical protein
MVINHTKKNLSLAMHRSIGILLMIWLCFGSVQCTRYVNPPVPEAELLLTSGSWVLVYSDSISVDSTNTLHYFHLPAQDCEKKELLSFAHGLHYSINLVCPEHGSGTFSGEWTYFSNDSSLGYGSDTALYLKNAFLKLVTKDTLKLIQQSSFATPEIQYSSYVEKTYSR